MNDVVRKLVGTHNITSELIDGVNLNRKIFSQYVFDNHFKPLLDSDRGKKWIELYNDLFQVADVDNKKVRIGNNNDGGYVMLDDFEDVSAIYSIGISDEISFDKYLVDHYGKDIFMYDHTIDKLPYDNKKFHWKKIGLCSNINRLDNCKTLNEIIEENGHQKEEKLILKMDIEGFEWDVLQSIDENCLKRFSQIVMELHGILDYNNKNNIENAIRNLNKTHQLIHIHANNFGGFVNVGDRNIPEFLEVLYVNKEHYKIIESNTFFPTNLDCPNMQGFPDIPLGFWN